MITQPNTLVRVWMVNGVNPNGVVSPDDYYYNYNNLSYVVAVVAPAPDVAGGPNMTAPAGAPTASVTLDGSGSACFFGPCNYTFTLLCSAENTLIASNLTTSFTIGPNSSYDINMRGEASAKTCRYRMYMYDTQGTDNYYEGYIQVRVPRAGPCRSHACVQAACHVLQNRSACGSRRRACSCRLIQLSCDKVRASSGLSERLRPPPNSAQVPPLRLYADLAGGPLITATAGDNITLDARGSVCLDGCSQLITVECPDMNALFFLFPYTNESVVALTTGPGPTYDINMLRLQNGLTCNVSVTAAGYGTDTVTASLKVWRLQGRAARMAGCTPGTRVKLRGRLGRFSHPRWLLTANIPTLKRITATAANGARTPADRPSPPCRRAGGRAAPARQHDPYRRTRRQRRHLLLWSLQHVLCRALRRRRGV